MRFNELVGFECSRGHLCVSISCARLACHLETIRVHPLLSLLPSGRSLIVVDLCECVIVIANLQTSCRWPEELSGPQLAVAAVCYYSRSLPLWFWFWFWFCFNYFWQLINFWAHREAKRALLGANLSYSSGEFCIRRQIETRKLTSFLLSFVYFLPPTTLAD